MRTYLKFALKACLLCCMASVPAYAELNVDSRAIFDRMDRLERDVTLLQRRLYKKDDDAVGASQNTAASEQMPESSVQQLYLKLNDQDRALSEMTAQVEELAFQLAQLKEEVKKINTDVDFRFKELAGRPATLPAINPRPVVADVPENDAPKDPKAAYNDAYNLLKQLKYEQAEVALQDFLQKYPDHELAGNAQYWLGETYYVRGLYEPAAVAFATGFKKYKKSTKGADNLLKLGLSMQQLGKEKEACTAFKNLKKEFPKASDLLLSRAKKESNKLGCK